LPALFLALALTPEGPPLPERLGAFALNSAAPLTLPPGERELYSEYRLSAAERAEYVDGHARRMVVEAFRFTDIEGAHAAYLYSRPPGGISPMIWEIDAVTGGGITVVEFRNYMLRFRGALPSISSEMGEMLAARIPASLAGFPAGAKGRMARFETPAGPVTEVVFEYPTEEIAREQAKALATLPGSFVHVDRACAGVIFDPVDSTAAEELLAGSCGSTSEIEWDPNTLYDGPMTLSQGMGGVGLWGLFFGVPFAGVRRFRRAVEPFPNRMIFLQL